jgi:hypothetical protein
MRNSQTPRAFAWPAALTCLLLAGAMAAFAPSAARAQDTGEEWKVDPLRGPVDLGLVDPSLIGAIDIHLHIDPDAPGTSGVIRALDVIEAVNLAKARGMRGFVFKTHQDAGSAGAAYLMRKHIAPGFEVFGRMASNYATGGISARSRAAGAASTRCRPAIRSPPPPAPAAWTARTSPRRGRGC